MKRIQFPTNKLYLLFLVSFCTISCNNDSDLLTDYVISRDENGQFGMLVVNDYFETNSKNSIILDVLSNDRFSENEEVKIIEISNPKLGAVKVNENNTITYTPPTEILEEEGFTETPTNESPAEPTPEEETPSSEETPSDQNPPVEAPPATSSSSEEEPGSNENVTDTFTYTTEVVNEDETVSTEVGTVEVVIIPTDNSTSEPTIPDPVSPIPISPNANLLFASGFEGVNLGLKSTPDRGYQAINGTDSGTGFSWPPLILGSNYGGIHLVNDGGGSASNSVLQTVVGHTGASTTALYRVINYDATVTQLPYQINNIKENPESLYVSYWMKIDGSGLDKNYDWAVPWEYKTYNWDDGNGYRVIAYFERDGNTGKLRARLAGDAGPNGHNWSISNETIVPPFNEWFKIEYFIAWGDGVNTGRAWWKINGEMVADHTGRMTYNNDDLGYLFVTQQYGGNSYPISSLVDDLEIWDNVPY